jgi:hypothetical protein
MNPLPRRDRNRIALAWSAAVLLALALLSPAPGVSRDEAASFGAAERLASFWTTFAPHPLRAAAALDTAFPRRPPLAETIFGAFHAVARPLGEAASFRFGAVVFAALLTWLVAVLGADLAGRTGAILAPALFWLVPRHLQLGLSALPDLPEATLYLAALAAWRQALAAATQRARTRSALAIGLAVGGAAAIRPDGWALLPLLGIHAGLLRLHARRIARRVEEVVALRDAAGEPRAADPPDAWAARARTIGYGLAAAAVLAPVAVLVTGPWILADPLHRIAFAFRPTASPDAWLYLGRLVAGRLPPEYPLAVTALAVPTAVLAIYVGGVGYAMVRLARAVRARQAADASGETLLLLFAAAPFALAATGLAPFAPGVRPWIQAMPVLAVLGARAVAAAAGALWPSRRAQVAASLAVLALWPAARATIHHFPHGAAAWNELAGGTPGAASLGMQRQDGGEATRAALPVLAAHARPGARIWWPGTAPEAVRAYRHDGRLRPDLLDAAGPEEADLVVVPLDGGSRAAEYRAWTELRTARPAAGVFLDEVPLAWVYARPGAWR